MHSSRCVGIHVGSAVIKGLKILIIFQINTELAQFVSRQYHLPVTAFSLAVCGIRVLSEHEDECCVMLELHPSEVPLSCGCVGSVFNGGDTAISSSAELLEKVRTVLKEAFLRDANCSTSGITKGSKVIFICAYTTRFDFMLT